MKFIFGLVLIGLSSAFLWGLILGDVLDMTSPQILGATVCTYFIAMGIAVSSQDD